TSRYLEAKEQVSEALLMGLRLAEGLDLDALEERFNVPANAMLDASKLHLHEGLGLVWRDGSRLGVTAKGMPVLNALLADLVSAELVSA
ncbi:MAG: hypothetical protein ABJH26_11975, partial [Marinomonas sp.]